MSHCVSSKERVATQLPPLSLFNQFQWDARSTTQQMFNCTWRLKMGYHIRKNRATCCLASMIFWKPVFSAGQSRWLYDECNFVKSTNVKEIKVISIFNYFQTWMEVIVNEDVQQKVIEKTVYLINLITSNFDVLTLLRLVLVL